MKITDISKNIGFLDLNIDILMNDFRFDNDRKIYRLSIIDYYQNTYHPHLEFCEFLLN